MREDHITAAAPITPITAITTPGGRRVTITVRTGARIITTALIITVMGATAITTAAGKGLRNIIRDGPRCARRRNASMVTDRTG